MAGKDKEANSSNSSEYSSKLLSHPGSVDCISFLCTMWVFFWNIIIWFFRGKKEGSEERDWSWSLCQERWQLWRVVFWGMLHSISGCFIGCCHTVWLHVCLLYVYPLTILLHIFLLYVLPQIFIHLLLFFSPNKNFDFWIQFLLER